MFLQHMNTQITWPVKFKICAQGKKCAWTNHILKLNSRSCWQNIQWYMNSYYFHKNTHSLTTVYHIAINCLTMFTYAKTSKYTSKPLDITRYSDSIQFQSPTMLTLAGLCNISQFINQTMEQFHCFLWNFTNSPVMTILTIFSFYFIQYILCNWKSVVTLLDKQADLKEVYSISNFIAFALTLLNW